MPDMSPRPIEIEDELLTVEDAATLTGRSANTIRDYVERGIIDSVRDPVDRRRRLIPSLELAKVLKQPRRGYHQKTVVFTKSDGSTYTRRLVVKDHPPTTETA